MACHIKKFSITEALKTCILLIPLFLIFSWFGSHDIWHNNFEKFSNVYFLAALFRLFFTIYIAFFFYLIGNFLVRRFQDFSEAKKYIILDHFLIASFVGASITSLFTYLLAIIGFLDRNFLFFIFASTFFWLILHLKPSLNDCKKKLLPSIIKYLEEKDFNCKLLLILLSVIFLYLLLWKGIVAPLFLHDVIAHYNPYLEHVVSQGNINPSHWYLEFFLLKGASLHYLSILFMDIESIQLIGFYFLVLLALLLFSAVKKISKSSFLSLFSILILFSLPEIHTIELQKLHIFISAYVVFIYYVLSLMLDEKNSKSLTPMIFSVALSSVALVSMSPTSILWISTIFATHAIQIVLSKEYYRIKYLLSIFFATSLSLSAILIFNYYKFGLIEMFPLLFFMKHGDPSKFLNFISPVDGVFFQNYDNNNASQALYNLIGIIDRKGFLVGISEVVHSIFPFKSTIIFLGALGAFLFLSIKKYIAKINYDSYLSIIFIYVLVSLIIFMFGSFEKTYMLLSKLLMFFNFFNLQIILIIFLSLTGLIVTPKLKKTNFNLFNGSIYFCLFILLLMSLLPPAGSTERSLVFIGFFKLVIVFYLLATIVIPLLYKLPLNVRVKKVFFNFLTFFVLIFFCYQFSSSYELNAHKGYVSAFVKRHLSYQGLYSSFGSSNVVEIESVIGKNKIIYPLNHASGMPGMPNSRVQHNLFNLYSDQRFKLLYGSDFESSQILRSRGVEFIYVNTNGDLFFDARSKLFSPEVIGSYFKVIWGKEGKFILTWNDNGAFEANETNFFEEYKACYQKNLLEGRSMWFPFYDIVREDLKKIDWLPTK
jgi:hypothetical protein